MSINIEIIVNHYEIWPKPRQFCDTFGNMLLEPRVQRTIDGRVRYPVYAGHSLKGDLNDGKPTIA